MPMESANDDVDMGRAVGNAAAFWTALATSRGHHVVQAPGFLAVAGGPRIGTRILVTSPSLTPADDDALRALVAEYRGDPLTVEDAFSVVDASALGLEVRQMPVMVRPPAAVSPSPDWTVTRVASEADLRVAERVVVDGFPLARLQPVQPGEAFPATLIDQPGVALFLIGRDAVVAGACLTVLANDVVGVYWVTTLPEFRSQGVGRALMTAILEEHAGLTMTLSASQAGRPLYESMGFRTVAKAAWWLPPTP